MPAASSSAAEAAAPRAAIVGLAGERLSAQEQALFRRWPPFGFILFRRNCQTPAAVRALVEALRALVGRPEAPVLIDQEGGRVMRICPPAWPARSPARALGRLAELDPALGQETAWLHARLIAADLAELGITVNCAPVLDLATECTTPAIGDRAFGGDPALVAALGLASIDGYLAGGVLPVIKHLPGHGRAQVDSHLALPVVPAGAAELAAADWLPFRA
jgi:beta-N-acetylhexosaminidase